MPDVSAHAVCGLLQDRNHHETDALFKNECEQHQEEGNSRPEEDPGT